MMETLDLIAHPALLPLRVKSVAARVVSFDANWCLLRWKLEGTRDLIIPAFVGSGRQDNLWQTTCFELFLTDRALPLQGEGWVGVSEAAMTRDRSGAGHLSLMGGAYSEFNFSPSERWAAYDFTACRTGMTQRPMARPPVITPRRGSDTLLFDVAIPAQTLPARPWRYGLTAVLEETGGVKSYWAATHPLERPDFHDPACHDAWLAAPPSP